VVRINLLGEREKKRRAPALAFKGFRRPEVPSVSSSFLLGIVALLVLAGAVFVYFSQKRDLGELEERIVEARADSIRYQKEIRRIREIEKKQGQIRARIEAIRQVDTGRFRWAHMMEEVSKALPEYMWLTSVVRSEAETEEAATEQVAAAAAAPSAADAVLRIEITGITYSNLTLTEFMTNLERSPYLGGVTLVGSSHAAVEGTEVTSFALFATYTEASDRT